MLPNFQIVATNIHYLSKGRLTERAMVKRRTSKLKTKVVLEMGENEIYIYLEFTTALFAVIR